MKTINNDTYIFVCRNIRDKICKLLVKCKFDFAAFDKYG